MCFRQVDDHLRGAAGLCHANGMTNEPEPKPLPTRLSLHPYPQDVPSQGISLRRFQKVASEYRIVVLGDAHEPSDVIRTVLKGLQAQEFPRNFVRPRANHSDASRVDLDALHRTKRSQGRFPEDFRRFENRLTTEDLTGDVCASRHRRVRIGATRS